ncbi:MAG: hypothetical protein HY657_16040 [Acidobacteria bacterium]|nr:hypothetical protein [Acidobacteriota bacterium]
MASQPEPRRSARVLRYAAALVGVGLVLYALSAPLLTFMGEQLIHADPPERVDALIVLAPAWDRILEAAELYHAGYAPVVLVTREWREPAEQLLLDRGLVESGEERRRQVLRALGVPLEAIVVLDDFVASTRSSCTTGSSSCHGSIRSSGMNAETGHETVVMTATFRADGTPFTVVRDERERLLQYLCGLVAWARPARVGRIVFGENSNAAFDFTRIVRHLNEAGKDVEVIVFDGNQEARRFGKGYGEGRILEHLFHHSELLRASPAFYKVTGRLFVSNFDQVSEATTSLDAFKRKRWKDPARPPKVITRFFKCSRALFEARLLDVYKQADDSRHIQIEHLYFDRLSDLDVPDLGVKPQLVGQQASTGEIYAPYDNDVIRQARSFM